MLKIIAKLKLSYKAKAGYWKSLDGTLIPLKNFQNRKGMKIKIRVLYIRYFLTHKCLSDTYTYGHNFVHCSSKSFVINESGVMSKTERNEKIRKNNNTDKNNGCHCIKLICLNVH